MKTVLTSAMLFVAMILTGCEKASDKPASKEVAKPATPTKAKDDHDHPHGDEHDHAPKNEGRGAGHGDEVVELGSAKLGEFDVRASRDKVDFKPGGDAPVDVWIDGGVGEGVAAVRFWIGVESAKGSMKAKADIENGKWHTHVEIPAPLPAESKLWVEVEESGAKKSLVSFDLNN